jgi:hypothetical protein
MHPLLTGCRNKRPLTDWAEHGIVAVDGSPLANSGQDTSGRGGLKILNALRSDKPPQTTVSQ